MLGSQRFIQQKTKLSDAAILGLVAIVAATSVYFLTEEMYMSENTSLVSSEISDDAVKLVASAEKFWQDPVEFFAMKAYGETQSRQDAERAAQNAYNDAIIKANLALEQIQTNEDATDEERAEAKQAFTQALLDAKAEYEQALQEIKEKYAYNTIEEAREAYLKTLSDAKAEYEQAIADATTDKEVRRAAEIYNQTVLDAVEEYKLAQAELGGNTNE